METGVSRTPSPCPSPSLDKMEGSGTEHQESWGKRAQGSQAELGVRTLLRHLSEARVCGDRPVTPQGTNAVASGGGVQLCRCRKQGVCRYGHLT